MKKKTFSKLLISLFAVAVLATGCSSGGSESKPEKKTVEGVPDKIAKDDQVKIMVVRKIGGDDHTAQFLAGAKQEGTSMGFTVDTFSANGDTAKFHDAISQALEKDYDGFIISHGDDAATVEDVKKITAKGIPVVAFDSNPDLKNVDGVTLTSQDDENLAKLALTQMNEELKGQGNIIYLWVDGFPPMVRRMAVYKDFLAANSGIKEVERFGIASGDVSVQTQNAVSAMLTKHKKGEISAIFATWDAFAIGAARAVKEAGRDEIKIYGIDVSNADLQMIQEDKSPWVSTAAVDPKVIGQVDVRMLAKKIAGEDVPQTYDLAATLITQDKLKSAAESINMVNLAAVLPGWGVSDAFEEAWMTKLKEAYAK
ncbi:sugar ABC transporter substrate-binding protein [Paenibacillus sp. SAF-054]|uniref:sugar ABC transporter substrate-binding protein n=1 Tax=unclassified Paenibacillus TaxID=185978 RepID=UPI003F7E3A72